MSDCLMHTVLMVLTLVPTMRWLVMIVLVVISLPSPSVVVRHMAQQSVRYGLWAEPSGLEGRPVVLPLAAVSGPVGLTQDIGSVLVEDSSLGNVLRFRRLSKS